VDVHHEIARQRQHGERVLVRVCPDEHDRVRARLEVALRPLALVVADHERDRRLVRGHHVELFLGLLQLRRAGADVGDLLRVVEEQAAPGAGADDDHDREHPQRDRPDQVPERPPRRRGLPVDADGRQRVGREDGATVAAAVRGRRAADASLERGLHFSGLKRGEDANGVPGAPG
jgi:hypothetical protein